MRRRALLAGTAVLGATGLLSACARLIGGDEGSENTIIDIARTIPDLSTFVQAVDAAGLAATLDGPGPFTVFAPSNAAFNALPEGELAALLQPGNRTRLRNALAVHAIPGSGTTDRIRGQRRNVPTAQGQTVLVDGTGGGVRINGANVIRADIAASNGYLNIVDRVILPR
jgi:uncharacterized surface protein with fasciclin (FAS1) repeats